jgi:hypothetical protein
VFDGMSVWDGAFVEEGRLEVGAQDDEKSCVSNTRTASRAAVEDDEPPQAGSKNRSRNKPIL